MKTSPFFGRRDPRLFDTWLGWLTDLGGSFNVFHELPDTVKRSGRRDTDKNPRRYPAGFHKEYWMERRDTNGV